MATPHEQRKQRSAEAKAIRLARQRRKAAMKAVAVVVVVLLVVGGLITGLALTNSGTPAKSQNQQASDQAGNDTPTTQVPPVAQGATAPDPTPCPAINGSQARTSVFKSAPPMCIDVNKKYSATFDTTEGKVVVALDAKTMPEAVNNFVVLSRYKFYDGSAIVRTNNGIDIIQGGAPNTQDNSDPGPGYTIKDADKKSTYTDGDLVMARTMAPNSTGAQWFFGAGPKVSQLDSQGNYIKLGHTTEGLDILHKILGMHTASSPSEPDDGKPAKAVVVNSITISEG